MFIVKFRSYITGNAWLLSEPMSEKKAKELAKTLKGYHGKENVRVIEA